MRQWKNIPKLFLLAGLVAYLAGFNGCVEDPPIIVPIDNDRIWGPPYGEIAFLEDDLALGTISADTDSVVPHFIYGTGQGKLLSDPGFRPTWIPMATWQDSIPEFAIYDADYTNLLWFTEDGQRDLISDSVVHSAFDVSTAGTRIAYVRQQKDTTQHVIREAFGSVVRDSIDLYTVVPPLRVRNAPCIEQFEMSLRVLVNIVNDDNPSENMFFFLTSDKRVLNEHPVNALDVKIDPANDGIAKVAYILGDNGYESASQLYWTWLDRGVYAVKFVYDFAQHGVGAATFSWSPDGHYIAMFTGIFTAEPKLVIISDLSAFENGEIPLEKSIVLPQDENLYFASPDWAPSSDRVVLLVRNDDEEKNEVVIVNIETREMIVKVDGLSTDIIFNPTWKK